MALALRRYRKSLLASGLLSPAELADFERALPRGKRPSSGDDLARLLIEAGRLTEFQAGEIVAGRTTALVLGNYVVLDRIGAGGMGQVFKAWHRRMERVVALKTLPDQRSAGEDSVARFRREVLSAARLSHPNIVAAYDADVCNGIHYLVMEYVNGPNLSDVLRQRGPLPLGEAVRSVIDAARGLAYAHSQGIVHRDIKPSNLIADRSKIVKVLDLGLARMPSLAAGAELTLPGDVVGTLEYMAPEQAAGSRDVDHRADIYGLGCTLYRLVVGDFPFPGRTPQEIIAAHRNQAIPSLRAGREEVPRSLDAVFKRMVTKEPTERIQSMQEVVDALERLRLADKRSNGALQRDSQPAENSESGDDVELAPTSPANPPLDAEVPRPAGEEQASERVTRPSSVAPVPPKVAIATLAAGLLLIAGLSWLDSDHDGPPPLVQDQTAGIYRLAREAVGEWSETLGVPLRMTNTLGMQFVLIPPSKASDNSSTDGGPFYFSVYELTVGQFQVFLTASGRSPSGVSLSSGERHPAIVSAADAEKFCRWLSDRERAVYRLPTEAEWSQACSAGTPTQWWFGDDATALARFAWFDANAAARTHQVGLLEANPFGLHDILGNAAEWCLTRNSLRPSWVLCGGSYLSPPSESGPARRNEPPAAARAVGGVRLVLELPAEARLSRHDRRP